MYTLGEKYYKTSDNKLELVRIIKINENEITIKDGARTKKIDSSYLNGFIRLKPAGIMNFNIVNMGAVGAEDIIITLMRTKDFENGITIPHAACRQCIMDVFTNMTNRNEQLFLGCSMSVENCPENFDYNAMLGCTESIKREFIAVYIDDSINFILSLVPNKSDFDKVLYKIHKNTPRAEYIGTSKTLYDLVNDNKFEYDFHTSFGIAKIKVKVKFDAETLALDPKVRDIVEKVTEHQMLRTYVTKYTPTINLNKIERNHVLISDKLGDLYIIAYDKGEYIPDEYRKSIRAVEDLKILMGKK